MVSCCRLGPIHDPFRPPILAISSMAAATAAAGHACAVQNLKDWLRPCPTLHIDFLARDAAGGLDQGLVLASSGAEFALSMHRNLDTDGSRSQVRYMAEKRHGALAVAVFHFSIGRTHATERLYAALDALRHPSTLAGSHLVQGVFPYLLETGLADIERLLLRDDANAHLAVSIDGEPVHSAAAEIDRVVLRQVRRILQIAFGQPAILAQPLGGMKIERHHLFWRKPHCQRTLGAVDAGIDLAIALEFDPEFLFREPPHGGDFVLVDAGGDGLELERQASFAQQFDAAQTSLIGAGDRGQLLVRLFGPSVQRDFDGERWPLHEIVGNLFVDQRAI